MIKQVLKEAFILKTNGYYKHSIEAFYKALELDNNSVELIYEIAESYFLMGDIERALSYLEQILEKDPAHIDSLKLLKDIFISKKAWQEAELTAKNIYFISKKTSDLVEVFSFLNKQGKYSDIFAYEFEEESSDLLYEMAFAKSRLNEYTEAEILIDKALFLDQEDTRLLLLKGNILLELNKDNAAYQVLKMLPLDFNNYEIMTFAGLVYQRLGEYKKSIECFLEALKKSPYKDECYYNCASTYFKMNEISLAKKYYNLAISSNSENPGYHLALANLYYLEKNYKRALEELKSDFYEARLLKSIILFEAGYYAISRKEFEKLLEENPEDIKAKEYCEKINEKMAI